MSSESEKRRGAYRMIHLAPRNRAGVWNRAAASPGTL